MSQVRGITQLVLIGPLLVAAVLVAGWFTLTGVVAALVAWPGLLVIAGFAALAVHAHTRTQQL